MLERQRLQSLVETSVHPGLSLGRGGGEIWYFLDRRPGGGGRVGGTRSRPGCIGLAIGLRKRDLETGALGRVSQLGKVPEASTSSVETLVCALARADAYGVAWLDAQNCREVLPNLCTTGRVALLSAESAEPCPLSWDDGDPWRLFLHAERPEPELLMLTGLLTRDEARGEQTLRAAELTAALPPELFIYQDCLHQIARGYGRWLLELCQSPLSVVASDAGWFVQQLSRKPFAPQIQNLSVLGFALDTASLKPLLRLELPKKSGRLVRGELLFKYGSHVFRADPEQSAVLRERRADAAGYVVILRRDYAAETRSVVEVQDAGFVVEPVNAAKGAAFIVHVDLESFVAAAEGLLAQGFAIEAEGQPLRRATSFSPIIESEQDWFSVKGGADFQGCPAELPALLEAVRRAAHWVRLGDGSLGLLPKAWLASLTMLAAVTSPPGRSLRFHGTQALLLGEATDSFEGLRADPAFIALRARLAAFTGTQPLLESSAFNGTLREYQRAALGWISALDELGFRGCLADDMGLGKTVVVAAWLLLRKQSSRTSLLVVPRSLLFNWESELARFSPSLSVKLHHGSGRAEPDSALRNSDVVITSYGTLRRDATALATIDFDYVVLDEAHRIKNRGSDTFRAATELRSHARLALTGTPFENHLGEVWALLSYLNPHLFEHQEHLRKTFERKRPSDVALEQVILKAVRPFVLRRTKKEVAPELPARVEKTLLVTLSKAERRRYDELAAFYKARIIEDQKIRRRFGPNSGLTGGNGHGAARSLEALLRLRQAACHSGLLDDSLSDVGSAKTDVLIDHLLALQAEGHKALVFSQFTELLGLLENSLTQAGLRYVVLTGKTRDRQAVVEKFQQDASIDVFLISLKAGGVGLNLVAADYVFILDPWWNPASEAQAIDRAHRIGQARTVVAYRLLCRGTVEEKVAALQEKKRRLAAELFDDPGALSTGFTQDDLEALVLGS